MSELASCQVVFTRSGSRAMLDRASGEVMHPIGGPLLEAERLYVTAARLEQRLRAPDPRPVVLLDIGLGAGSNAAAAVRLRESLPAELRQLSIVSIDKSRAALKLALEPEHAAEFGWTSSTANIARTLVNEGAYASARIDWQLREADILETLARELADCADIVFWDPFSPGANPELWTLAAFRALRRVCRPGATVHTYSGATAVRSALLLADFRVGIGEKIAAGKHATIGALSPSEVAHPLDQRWLARLARSSAPFPPDAPPNALERVRALPQFARS
jgi:queuine tRNA-ribosyltransferase